MHNQSVVIPCTTTEHSTKRKEIPLETTMYEHMVGENILIIPLRGIHIGSNKTSYALNQPVNFCLCGAYYVF